MKKEETRTLTLTQCEMHDIQFAIAGEIIRSNREIRDAINEEHKEVAQMELSRWLVLSAKVADQIGRQDDSRKGARP